MGAAGFSLPLTSCPDALDEEAFEELWADLVELINDWVEKRLARDVEADLLEGAEELLEWPCDVPPTELSFMFREDEIVCSAAGMHWYLRALHEASASVRALLRDHGFEARFEALPPPTDGTVLLFPEDGEMDAILIWPDHRDEVGFGDGAVALAELPDDLRAEVEAAQKEARCHCSLCAKRS